MANTPAPPPRPRSAACLRAWASGLALLLLAAPTVSAASFYINYSATPDPAALRAYQVSILSPNARINLADAQRAGHKSYAYLSVIEVAPDAPYRKELAALAVPLLGRNEEWQSDLADVSQPAWADFVVNRLAARAVDRGFDGFFLDTADSVELLARKFPQRAAAFRAGLVNVITSLKAKFPQKKIILNRGFSVWDSVRGRIDGVLVESLYQSYNFGAKQYTAVDPAGTEWLLGKLTPMRAAGIPVFIVDYVDPANAALAEITSRRIQRAGFSAFITTPELSGVVVGSVPVPDAGMGVGISERPRFLLTLFGNQARDLDSSITIPVDSFVAQVAQMPLEWLGYEVEYLNPSTDALPPQLDTAKYAGVILDRLLRVPPSKEDALATWLVNQKRAGRKIIFMGEIPLQEDEPLQRVLREFGWTGNGRVVRGASRVETAFVSPRMNYEAPVNVHTNRFLDLRAAAGVDLLLSLRARDAAGAEMRFDPVFTAPWGGATLDPYTFFRRPDLDDHWLVDPFHFFASALGAQDWPVPDVTTRDGVRIFYTHIDGDGFRHYSTVEAKKRSSEVVFERVVKKYPYPFTCSIIEAEVRGRLADQKPGDEQFLTQLARAIFALPKVEAASHSYSHPFYWAAGDKTAAMYERMNLKLAAPWDLKQLDVRQEIAGSVKFIEDKLLPPDKKVKVFLWPGNCRPPLEALRMTRELGIENMNGGETIISRKHPSVTRVSARVMPLGDELQIFAANENENVYQNRWQADREFNVPFYGGFIHAQDGFERMEIPRRLKPVNIYFHWYSGDNPAALNALLRLFNWAVTQELHSMTAAEFARLVRDARATRVSRVGEDRWLLSNTGTLRTFRLPKSGRVPDIAASRGVTGWRAADDVIYVHTDGSPRVELALATRPTPHLFLVSSTAEIRFSKLAPRSAAFTVRDLRPVKVTLGGLAAKQKVSVNIAGNASTGAADAKGQIHFELPADANVTVDAN